MQNPFEPIEERLTNIENLLLANQTNRQSEPDQYISISSSCSILSVSRPTVYEYLKSGRLKKYKIGSTTRLLKSEVLALVKPA
jgi:excisionase family DNA binding protein